MLVGNEETKGQAVSRRSGMNWTEILARNGLESPGYKETVDQMRKEGRIKDKKGAK
jgi:hypothetical protein